jgi:peptidyl-dipeptidase Dcp
LTAQLSASPAVNGTDEVFRRDNPFYAPSALPYGAPPFDRIQDSHYQPAIEEGMRRHLDEVSLIAEHESPATFDNTIIALELSGELLTRALKAFGGITGANTNDTLQAVQSELAPRLAAHSDAVYLNERLYERVSDVYEQRSEIALSPEQHMLVERYHLDFVRSGARLSEGDKSRLRALNQEESTLATDLQNRLLAAAKAGALVVDDIAELEGLDEAAIAAAAESARERALDGQWVLPLQNTTQQPAQASLRRRETRRRLFEAALHRADRGDDLDTRHIVQRLAQLRAEQARLLGYATSADYVLEDQMAKTPPAAIRLLTEIGAAAVAKARAESRNMQRLIDRKDSGVTLEPWDWQYYAEQLRKSEYDLDESQLRPYFELDRVLQEGVFFAATMLYGITFRERTDLPVYHPDVRVFEVFEEDGTALALFYGDFHKRDNKSGGAWMDSFVDQADLLGTRAVVYNVTNFSRPPAGQPTLLSYDDVTTLFHEFGHALHGMFSRVQYPKLTGTNVPRDFVEFPSQFNEHWVLDPVVFSNYARHYETAEPMPHALVEKIKKTQTFNQGFALTEYISAALLDMAWHTLPADAPLQDVAAFERQALERYAVRVHEVPPRYDSTYFAHIWNGGYNAGYYAYLWAEVLDHDAFAWLTEHGGPTRNNGDRLREMILSRGGTADAATLYRSFRGREPSVDPLLAKRGLTAPGGT